MLLCHETPTLLICMWTKAEQTQAGTDPASSPAVSYLFFSKALPTLLLPGPLYFTLKRKPSLLPLSLPALPSQEMPFGSTVILARSPAIPPCPVTHNSTGVHSNAVHS